MESVKLLCSKFTAHLGAAHTLILFLINTFKENKLNEMLCPFSLDSVFSFIAEFWGCIRTELQLQNNFKWSTEENTDKNSDHF